MDTKLGQVGQCQVGTLQSFSLAKIGLRAGCLGAVEANSGVSIIAKRLGLGFAATAKLVELLHRVILAGLPLTWYPLVIHHDCVHSQSNSTRDDIGAVPAHFDS